MHVCFDVDADRLKLATEDESKKYHMSKSPGTPLLVETCLSCGCCQCYFVATYLFVLPLPFQKRKNQQLNHPKGKHQK